MGLANLPIPVVRIDKETGERKLYNSLHQAAKDNYCTATQIGRVLKGIYKTTSGYLWERIEIMNTVEKSVVALGETVQQVVVMEELAELQKEVSKMIRGKGNKDHLIEEMADVMVCLQTLKLIYSIEDELLQEKINDKLIRLENRLREGIA